jgi:hypothetical protein
MSARGHDAHSTDTILQLLVSKFGYALRPDYLNIEDIRALDERLLRRGLQTLFQQPVPELGIVEGGQFNT